MTRCFGLLAIVSLALLSPALVQADQLRVAVASNFYPTLNKIKVRFEQQSPHRLSLVRGSTGKLYAQIIHGAPYDVFLAADSKRPLKLEQAGLAVPGSRQTFAIGALALWRPNSSRHQIELMFHKDDYQRLAIANPKIAPYGAAAVDWLQQQGKLETARPKLIYGENIAQTYQFVESGSVDLGLVALSQVVHTKTYMPINTANKQLEQQLVIVKASSKQDLAQDFIQFLASAPIRQLIQQQGYRLP